MGQGGFMGSRYPRQPALCGKRLLCCCSCNAEPSRQQESLRRFCWCQFHDCDVPEAEYLTMNQHFNQCPSRFWVKLFCTITHRAPISKSIPCPEYQLKRRAAMRSKLQTERGQTMSYVAGCDGARVRVDVESHGRGRRCRTGSSQTGNIEATSAQRDSRRIQP